MRIFRFAIIISLLIFHPSLSGCEKAVEALQKNQSISGTELQRMLRAQDANTHAKALSFISDIYGPKINKGIAPDENSLYGLGQLVDSYLAAHPDKLNQAAGLLVMEALRNAPAQIEEQRCLWQKAYEAAQAYFLKPSPDDAEKFRLSLPNKQLPALDFKGELRLVDLVFDEFYPGNGRNISLLEKNIESREPHQVDLGFRLINIADGAFAEELLYDLGKLIPEHPRLFLQELLANQAKTEPEVLEPLASILHPVAWWEIRDDSSGQKYMELLSTRLNVRIKALETVKDKDLKKIRDLCISILKKMQEEKGG